MSELSYKPKFENGLIAGNIEIKSSTVRTTDSMLDTDVNVISEISSISVGDKASLAQSDTYLELNGDIIGPVYTTTLSSHCGSEDQTSTTLSASCEGMGDHNSQVSCTAYKANGGGYYSDVNISTSVAAIQDAASQDVKYNTHITCSTSAYNKEASIEIYAGRTYNTGTTYDDYESAYIHVNPKRIKVEGALVATKWAFADVVAQCLRGNSYINTGGWSADTIKQNNAFGSVGTVGLFYCSVAKNAGNEVDGSYLKEVSLSIASNYVKTASPVSTTQEGTWVALSRCTSGGILLAVRIR